MKHWVPDPSTSLGTSEPRRASPRRGHSGQSRLGSRIGLAIAVAFVVGLAWAIAPTSPVARELRR